MEIDLKQIKDLMRAIRQHNISELEISQGEESIRLRRDPAEGAVAGPGSSVAPPAPSIPPPAAVPSQAVEPTASETGDFIVSPFVGTFYACPAPDAPSFIQKGQEFKAGQVLCIVEAMKLMNEIEAEFDGTLLEVLIENGKPVEFGDKLFELKNARRRDYHVP
ncbi:MAG: acetyl-CoA carboxylase biotin carboxyl carrier protein [Myxococcales bacterium]|nr:MAG: acetyl-CoA carboxylase biotin carboxyl carrier protein [Myxococcales bacterium]